jgi:hypothetical protein
MLILYGVQLSCLENPSGVIEMPYFTSRAQDAAENIKLAQKAVEKATWDYRQGGSVDALNSANRKLADCHDQLYTVNSGLCSDDRGSGGN